MQIEATLKEMYGIIHINNGDMPVDTLSANLSQVLAHKASRVVFDFSTVKELEPALVGQVELLAKQIINIKKKVAIACSDPVVLEKLKHTALGTYKSYTSIEEVDQALTKNKNIVVQRTSRFNITVVLHLIIIVGVGVCLYLQHRTQEQLHSLTQNITKLNEQLTYVQAGIVMTSMKVDSLHNEFTRKIAEEELLKELSAPANSDSTQLK